MRGDVDVRVGLLFFFFQAEDGIRDYKVTGVQTCALPIYAHPELLYDVHRTAASVADKLKSFGCDDVVTGIGRTGVVGVIRGRKSGGGEREIGRASCRGRV